MSLVDQLRVSSLCGLLMCAACSYRSSVHDADTADGAGRASEPRAAGSVALRRGLARNVIVFMGDGMGPEQLAAGRFEAGGQLRLDALSGPALAVTDSLTTLYVGGDDRPPTDSAAGATWIATGLRVENEVVSVAPNGWPLETVLERCQRAGKATGLVTTAYFFDASPAAFAAHQPSRNRWPEIARQMLAVTQPEVIMGNGGDLYDDSESGVAAAAQQAGYAVVRDAAGLAAWDPSSQPRLLGLFDTDFVPLARGADEFTMTPALERREDSSDPTLATMTIRAIEHLAGDPDGFFLFAEDEITDEIGHRGPAEVEWANRALPAEIKAIDEAVAQALDWVREHSSFDETLIVVLADHETGGYHFDHSVGPSSGDFAAYSEDSTGFRAGHHTRTPTAVYARGPGSDAIDRIEDHGDTHQLLLGEL